MSESENRSSPPETQKPFVVKISGRPKVQQLVDNIEEQQETKHGDLEFTEIRAIARDIAAPTILAERSKAKLKIVESESRHDIRTGLLNRRGYEERLKKAAAQAKRDGTTLSLMLGDIRDLGKLNNELSMEAGDALIIVSGSVVKNNLRENDEGAMWGGDAVGILYSNTPLEQALVAGTRLAGDMAQPQTLRFKFKGEDIEITMPIGFRAVVGEIDPLNPQASELAIKEELSAMKNQEKALKAQGQPIGGNKIVSIASRQQAA